MALWIALGVLAFGVVGGLTVAIVRGIRLWRMAKRAGGTIGSELDRISGVAGEIEQQLGRANASATNLAAAAERLRASRARLDVQLAALREARAQLARTFWFVPGR